jgi:hypothetical protein
MSSPHADDTLPLRTRHLKARDVPRFRNEAFQTSFRRPAYRLMIAARFGAAAADEVDRMVTHTLPRRALAESAS